MIKEKAARNFEYVILQHLNLIMQQHMAHHTHTHTHVFFFKKEKKRGFIHAANKVTETVCKIKEVSVWITLASLKPGVILFTLADHQNIRPYMVFIHSILL